MAFSAVAAVAAVASVAVSAGSAIAGASTAAANAKDQAAANHAAFLNQIEDRNRAIDYAQEVFAADLSYGYQSLDFQKSEFSRQAGVLDRNRATIEKNRDTSIGGVIMRQLEEDVASTLQELGISRDAGTARASLQTKASGRGVEGNSVDAILNDVTRQEGNAMETIALNRSATNRNLTRAVIEARAGGTQQLLGQAAQVYAPGAQPRTMGPMGAINNAAPVQNVSPLAAIAGIGGAVLGGFNTYNSLSGVSARTTMNAAATWLGNQFSIPSAAPASGGGLTP